MGEDDISVKDRIGYAMLKDAEDQGLITKDTVKLQLKRRHQLIEYAIKEGLVTLEP